MSSALPSASRIAAEIRSKSISPVEVARIHLERIERLNPKLNAFVDCRPELVLQQARHAEKAMMRGDVLGPLHGVPLSIKASIDVAGHRCEAGTRLRAGYVAAQDAPLVARLRAAGAVILGVTNTPELLMAWETDNLLYGRTNNPWDLSRAPGGSSGGSAAALAAGLTGFEAGSDIGSSIRNPAHYCGVFGHKPTWGIVPPRGQALPGRVSQADISVIGPLGRSAEDLEIGLGVMAGPDEIDTAGYKLTLAKPRQKALRDFKVAVMLTDPVSEVDLEVQARIQAVAEFLVSKRAKVSDRARPDVDSGEAQRVYIQLLRAATSGRLTVEEFEKTLEAMKTLEPEDESYYARMVRANVISHRDWLAANERRQRMRWKWVEFFKEYDLLLCPAAASAAFPHDQQGERHERTIEINGRRVPTTDQLFWAGYSGMVYLPSTVAPAGFTKSGLPVGVQIVGPQYGDRTCIHMARLLEREFQAFVPPPDFP